MIPEAGGQPTRTGKAVLEIQVCVGSCLEMFPYSVCPCDQHKTCSSAVAFLSNSVLFPCSVCPCDEHKARSAAVAFLSNFLNVSYVACENKHLMYCLLCLKP